MNIKTFSCKISVFFYYFNKICLVLTHFRKTSSNIKFNQNPLSGSRIVPCGQTDGHNEAEVSLFAILRTSLKYSIFFSFQQPRGSEYSTAVLRNSQPRSLKRSSSGVEIMPVSKVDSSLLYFTQFCLFGNTSQKFRKFKNFAVPRKYMIHVCCFLRWTPYRFYSFSSFLKHTFNPTIIFIYTTHPTI